MSDRKAKRAALEKRYINDNYIGALGIIKRKGESILVRCLDDRQENGKSYLLLEEVESGTPTYATFKEFRLATGPEKAFTREIRGGGNFSAKR